MLNRAEIIGYLGRDPEPRYTPDGTLTVTLNIATTEKWKDANGQKQERTEWHRCVAWARLAEVCQKYLTKGGLVYVDGRLETRKWTDKEGVERYTTQIRMDQMRMLSGRPAGQAAPAGANTAPAAAPTRPMKASDLDDDIPF